MSRRSRPTGALRTLVAPRNPGPGGAAPRTGQARLRAAGTLFAVLVTVVVTAAAPGTAAAASGGALEVRRTNAPGDAAVELAVVGPSTAKSSAVRVQQAGRDLTAQTAPLVSGDHPLAVLVQAEPEQLEQAQALVGDVLAVLPPDLRVQLGPVTGGRSGAPSAPQDPATALAGLDRMAAEPSASQLAATASTTAASGARARLVVTTCPRGEAPEVGSSSTTAWVLAWGPGCRDARSAGSPGVTVLEAGDLATAMEALPGLLGRVTSARSVRVTPQGSQPLVVSSGSERQTVALPQPAAKRSATGTGRGWTDGIVSAVALAMLAAAAVLVGVSRRRRRGSSPHRPAHLREIQRGDEWSRMIDDLTLARRRHQALASGMPDEPAREPVPPAPPER